jgi:hypothetical protein
MSLSRFVIIAGFVAALAAVGVLEWRARRPDSRLPRLGDVADFLLAYRVGRLPVGRIALLGFWWWVGWHFLAR